MNMSKIRQLLKNANMLEKDGETLKSPAVYVEQWPGGLYTKIKLENGQTLEG